MRLKFRNFRNLKHFVKLKSCKKKKIEKGEKLTSFEEAKLSNLNKNLYLNFPSARSM